MQISRSSLNRTVMPNPAEARDRVREIRETVRPSQQQAQLGHGLPPETPRRPAAEGMAAAVGEFLVEAEVAANGPAAYEGLNNRAKIAIAAYLTQQNAHRDEAKAEMSQLLGVDLYA